MAFVQFSKVEASPSSELLMYYTQCLLLIFILTLLKFYSTLSVVLAGEIVKLQLREVRMELVDLLINEPKESSIRV